MWCLPTCIKFWILFNIYSEWQWKMCVHVKVALVFLSEIKPYLVVGRGRGQKGLVEFPGCLKGPSETCPAQLLGNSTEQLSHRPGYAWFYCSNLSLSVVLSCSQGHIACQCWIMITPKAWMLNITRSGSWIAEVSTSPPAPSSPAYSS